MLNFLFPLVNGDNKLLLTKISGSSLEKTSPLTQQCDTVILLLPSWCHLFIFAVRKGSTFVQIWNSYVGAIKQYFSWVCPLAIQTYLEFSLESDKAVWVKSLLWIIMWELLIQGIVFMKCKAEHVPVIEITNIRGMYFCSFLFQLLCL